MHSFFWLILLLCLIIHFHLLFIVKWASSFALPDDALHYNLLQGLVYLLYPVCGWIAEVCFSNFKMIKCSFVILLMSSVTIVTLSIVYMVIHPSYQIATFISSDVIAVTFLLITTAGLGMFESNAIQFGMLEASSKQLSSFIHWYFWCAHIGPLVLFYIVMGTFLYLETCRFQMDRLDELSKTILNFLV